MPELPEVETLRADLEREIRGCRFAEVAVAQHRMTRGQEPQTIQRRLEGQLVESIGRRGKCLLIHLGSRDTLLLHRGMSGNLYLQLPSDPIGPHQRLAIELNDGRLLTLHDPRGFGELQVLTPAELEERCARLGPEPLGPDFTPEYVSRRFAGRAAPIKALLLDQRIVAGLGNIYVDESLWAARLYPGRPAGGVNESEAALLTEQIGLVLNQAIMWRGTTFSAARDLYRRDGNHGDRLGIFHRAICPRCGNPVAQTRIAGRGTSYCPVCQR